MVRPLDAREVAQDDETRMIDAFRAMSLRGKRFAYYRTPRLVEGYTVHVKG